MSFFFFFTCAFVKLCFSVSNSTHNSLTLSPSYPIDHVWWSYSLWRHAHNSSCARYWCWLKSNGSVVLFRSGQKNANRTRRHFIAKIRIAQCTVHTLLTVYFLILPSKLMFSHCICAAITARLCLNAVPPKRTAHSRILTLQCDGHFTPVRTAIFCCCCWCPGARVCTVARLTCGQFSVGMFWKNDWTANCFRVWIQIACTSYVHMLQIKPILRQAFDWDVNK